MGIFEVRCRDKGRRTRGRVREFTLARVETDPGSPSAPDRTGRTMLPVGAVLRVFR
jgi:hypothetical protein